MVIFVFFLWVKVNITPPSSSRISDLISKFFVLSPDSAPSILPQKTPPKMQRETVVARVVVVVRVVERMAVVAIRV